LVAPDKFRGTLTALQAAEAIEHGWSRRRPKDDLELVPMADGGEGTLETLVGVRGRVVRRRVHGPLGDTVDAELGLMEGSGVIEMARASGLSLLSAPRRDPRRTSTRGTGELMAAALDEGVRRLLVCLGGSATNDGGTGMAAALGVRFVDARGKRLRDGGNALLDLVAIDMTGLDRRIAQTDVIGVTDVDAPLTGPQGASTVFGPQKGASADDVRLLDNALGHLAAVVNRDLGIDLRDEPGAGAAGGLGFGLAAFCGAGLRPGVDVVMEATGFEGRLQRAGLVITGEGSLDEQSLRGKVVAGVLREARHAGRPVIVLAGRASVAPEGATVRSLLERFGEERAMNDARRALEDLSEDVAQEWA
jgi:glycerate kinase